ncbi:hypothetical protein IscW_ISCW011576 [Ixodes scapularis]|uniref:Uncharacterized protein n=1 Tax=Ixodes scapularis TaxID=6945 RepID=B7Q7N6_IXOSC|nr:hypothetical protein IscW_ISCW011576 [Ixodes scapularis]|eukprot:XP_002412191.1 hypothetical protein IscW_ISCW011576 [Ixodes scapularis]
MPYGFKYEAVGDDGGGHTREESADGSGRVVGSYTIFTADGLERRVYYEADENGFRAHIETNEPGTKTSNPADVTIVSSAGDYQPNAATVRPSKPVPGTKGPQRPDGRPRPQINYGPSITEPFGFQTGGGRPMHPSYDGSFRVPASSSGGIFSPAQVAAVNPQSLEPQAGFENAPGSASRSQQDGESVQGVSNLDWVTFPVLADLENKRCTEASTRVVSGMKGSMDSAQASLLVGRAGMDREE